ncbi:dienelactone hydrolase family protein [Candidatus Woesearchaeota archaeon]|nr:dienelactone hydrolase family protein [Candidatus Woesearchaeota archaeon]
MGWKYLILVISLFLLVSCAQQEHIVEQAAPNQIKNVDVLKNSDTSGITTEDAGYFGNSKGFLAKPKKEGIYPAVVMIHEWWGLNDNIKEMARSLAAEGYVVLAVDLFGKVAKTPDEARQLTSAIRSNNTGAIQNMKAAVEYLKKQSNVDDNKIASMGWCFGGQMSLQLSLNELLAATVIYYGNLEADPAKLSAIKWPVLGIFGEKDTSIPVESVKKFEAALKQLGIENEIHIYPNVGHAFANPSGANYAPNETMDAWKKTIGFLDRNLKFFRPIPDEWKACSIDSDCVETSGGPCTCANEGVQDAINKKYLDEWQSNLEKIWPKV